jgi:dihydrolipoamide dehydrogenase
LIILVAMAVESFDLVVLGAGPGGYTAAIRAAQLGLRAAIVEREELGGICLNRGCIPSKAMLRSAEVLGLLQHASDYGLIASGIEADFGAVIERRERIVAQLVQGVTFLLKQNHVTVIHGTGRLTGPNALEVEQPEGKTIVEFSNLILATGSRAATPPIPGIDLPGVIDSDGALALRTPPARLVICGAGAVGVEWAQVFRAFGSEVTILELLPQLVPTEEQEIARELKRAFDRAGIASHVGARVTAIRQVEGSLEVAAEIEGNESNFPADAVLLALGRRPNLDGLGLEAAGVAFEPRRLLTDAQMRTNVPHIYAIGDVTGRFLLAHIAAHQGIVAAETIAGHAGHSFDERIVPAAIFTHPEIASVGLRERAAREEGVPVRVGRFPFAASGRALASGESAGFVKIVAHEETGEVLGAHIIGPSAGEIIGEASLAMRLHATIDDLASTIHVHPTFSEAMLEAAFATEGTPVHVAPRTRAASSPS